MRKLSPSPGPPGGADIDARSVNSKNLIIMAGKPATSASYRIPVSSEYHQNCISGAVKVIRETIRRSATDKTFSQVEYRNCNAVAQEALWKEYVRNEIRATKDW